MKFVLATAAFYVTSLAAAGCFAQATFISSDMQCYELHIANVAFDSTSGNSYSIPLQETTKHSGNSSSQLTLHLTLTQIYSKSSQI